VKEIIFSQSQAQAFRRISGDHNPLHWDEEYSRRTQFGEPVLYGIAGLFKCLSAIVEGRNIDLQHVRVSFKRPLLMGQSYRLTVTPKDSNKYQFTIAKGKTTCLAGSLTLKSQDSAHKSQSLRFQTYEEPARFRQEKVSYQMEDTSVDALESFEREFGISPKLLPMRQFAALLWASYFVGMEYPGKQALLSSLEMAFEGDSAPHASLLLNTIEGHLDERFNQVTIQARGEGITVRLEAMQRPEPVDYEIGQIIQYVKDIPDFSGSRVLITGSSRGFGNVLAKAFLAKNATVLSIYSSFTKGAKQLEDDAKRTGGKVRSFQTDLSSMNPCAQIAEEISREYGHLDILVNNAFPQIAPLPYLDQDEEEFLSFVTRSIRLCSQPTRALLPLLIRGGTVVNISSLWTLKPEANFTHYLAAKGAIESLTRGLAVEFPRNRFMLVRAPRMLTDQTNVAFQRETPAPPVQVAEQVLVALARFPGDRNYLEI